MLFCEVSKVVGWKSPVGSVVYLFMRHLRILVWFLIGLLYLLFVDRSHNCPHYSDMLSMEC
jgi:hypothetical protein